MEDEPLSARFELLLKRYKEKLDLLDLNLPSTEEPRTPEPPAKSAEAPPEQPKPAPVPHEAPKEPAPELPAWERPSMQETLPPRKAPQPALPELPAPAPRAPRPRPVQTAPSAAAPKPRSRGALWLAGLLLASAAAWWGYGRFAQTPAYRSFSLSRTAVGGLAWREGRLVIADSEERFLLLYDADGKRVESKESINTVGLTDLCWADGSFWSTSKGRSAFFQHDIGPEHGVRRIYATPNRLPAAMSGDNENLWAADAQAPVVYRYLIGHSLNGVSLTPLNQYNLTGAPAAGLYAADGRLWVLDSLSRRLTRYGYDAGTLSPLDSVDLGARLPTGAAVGGLVVGGDFLWVLTVEPAVLHRFTLSDLRWQKARP